MTITYVQYDPITGLIQSTVTIDEKLPAPPHPNQIGVFEAVDALTQKVDVTQNPPRIIPYTPVIMIISRFDFYRRFTQAERIGIRASTDPIVIDFVDMLSHTDVVDLNDLLTQDGVNYLTSIPMPLLTQARAIAILTP